MNVTNYKQFQKRNNSNVSIVNVCMMFFQSGNSSNDIFIKLCTYGRDETKVNVGAQMLFSRALHTTPEDEHCMHLKNMEFLHKSCSILEIFGKFRQCSGLLLGRSII